MSTFDFISGEDFRVCLEADYQEMNSAIKIQGWKAVHVLAGSIIEALLIDALLSTGYQGKTNLSLDAIITECTNRNIISKKTMHISEAIKSYRNLIHPERVVRLKEIVDEEGAKLVQALVNIVIKEVSAKKKENYGYTAEQIVSKIERDHTVMPILGNLLKRTIQFEIKRLLLDLIPQRYLYLRREINIIEDNISTINALSILEACFHMAIMNATDETKKDVAKEFIRVVKEESAEVVDIYERVFFIMSSIKYMPLQDARIVKKHLLSNFEYQPIFWEIIAGIGEFITIEEVSQFTSAIIQTLSMKEFEKLDEHIRAIEKEYCLMETKLQVAFIERLDFLIGSCYDSNYAEYIDYINAIKQALLLPPFPSPNSLDPFDHLEAHSF